MVKFNFSIITQYCKPTEGFGFSLKESEVSDPGTVITFTIQQPQYEIGSFAVAGHPTCTYLRAIVDNPITSLENQLAATISCYTAVQQSLEKDEVFMRMYYYSMETQTVGINYFSIHSVLWCACTSHWGKISGLLVLALKLHEAGGFYTDWEKEGHYQNLYIVTIKLPVTFTLGKLRLRHLN